LQGSILEFMGRYNKTHLIKNNTTEWGQKMYSLEKQRLNNLENVSALALPSKVLVLLSKYAKALRNHNGTIIKLSSLRVFKHIHDTNNNSKSEKLDNIYKELLDEVNAHIKVGTMHTNQSKEESLKEQKKHPFRRNFSYGILSSKKTALYTEH